MIVSTQLSLLVIQRFSISSWDTRENACPTARLGGVCDAQVAFRLLGDTAYRLGRARLTSIMLIAATPSLT